MYKTLTRAVTLAITLLTALTQQGCKREMSPDELLQKCGSGVVLVLNQYYYKVTLPSCKPWYFTAINEKGEMQGLTFDKEEIEANRQMLTGTGFFVSTDGEIITNRHVARPELDLKDAKDAATNMINELQMLIAQEMQQDSYQYDQLEIEKNDCYKSGDYGNMYVDEERMRQINEQQKQLQESFEQSQQLSRQLTGIDTNALKVETVCRTSIAYNNSEVTKTDDFKPCNIIAVSRKEDIDLALLQLKSGKTPGDAHIFDIDESESDETTLTGESLFMIGYNAGFAIASTSQGIKAQITKGDISQKSDASKILYTIPALPGSSGSPVMNAYGNLVAVNFAGMQNTQGFNYGIRMSKVKEFMKERR